MTQKKITFEEALGKDDFGLIIGKDGELKGMFVPEEENSPEFIPDTLIQILETVYGLDMGDEVTIH